MHLQLHQPLSFPVYRANSLSEFSQPHFFFLAWGFKMIAVDVKHNLSLPKLHTCLQSVSPGSRAPLPRRFIKFLWSWLLSPILTGGQRKQANERKQAVMREAVTPSILLFFFFSLHFTSLIAWFWQGPCGWVWAPVTPCGRWEDHNRDQGRTWRRAVPSRKTDSEGEGKKLWARRCLKEAAGICSDGLCSLELLLKLDGGSSRKGEKGREVNPRPSTCSPVSLTTSWDGF